MYFFLKESTLNVEFKFNAEFTRTFNGISAIVPADANPLTPQTRALLVFLSLSVLNAGP